MNKIGLTAIAVIMAILSAANVSGCGTTDYKRIISFVRFLQTGVIQKEEPADDIVLDTKDLVHSYKKHRLYIPDAYCNYDQDIDNVCGHVIPGDTLTLRSCGEVRKADSSCIVRYYSKFVSLTKIYDLNHRQRNYRLRKITYYVSGIHVYTDMVLPNNKIRRIYQDAFKNYQYPIIGLLQKKLLCEYDVSFFNAYSLEIKRIDMSTDSIKGMAVFNMENDPIYGDMFKDNTKESEGSYYFYGLYRDYLKIISSDTETYNPYTVYKSETQIEELDNRVLYEISIDNNAKRYWAFYPTSNKISFYFDAKTSRTVLITVSPPYWDLH